MEYTDELRDELREELKATQTEDAMEAIIDQWIAESDITWTEAGEPWMIPAEEEVEEADE